MDSPRLRSGFGLGGRVDRALRRDPKPLFGVGTDDYWMEQALLASMESIGITNPNPAVGCILVQGDHEVARGATREYRKEHAERVAFANLESGTDLSQVTAYVTLEPCTHQGHQPPCIDLLLRSPIPRIVIGCRDPDPRVNGEGIRLLTEAGKMVELSRLRPELEAWHAPFFHQRKTGQVFWVAKWAETPSGHLADAEGRSKWITGAHARAYTHWLRQKYDAIVVGAGTFLADRPALTVRDCALPHQAEPERFVWDPKGRLDALNPKELRGFQVLKGRPKAESPWISLKEELETSARNRPLQSVLVEGGAGVLNGGFQAGLFSAIHRFVGTQTFTELSDRHQVLWKPGPGWRLEARHEFGQEIERDLLQEWVKED